MHKLEEIQTKEALHTDEMATILKEKMAEDYDKGHTKRDAHPKSLGVVKANFIVEPDLPKELKIGIFKEAKTFKAWIRFSNSGAKVNSDKKKEIRGIGIKLMGVEGQRFNYDEKQTQDFVLLSTPTMPLGTVQLFRDAVYYSIKSSPILLGLKFLFTGHALTLLRLATAANQDTSPLDIRYWSTTPYAFGDTAVKYKIVPTSTIESTLPDPLTDRYLTANMTKHLKKDIATFSFYIQHFKNKRKTPIEDAAVEWKDKFSPFVKVATIEIPIQTFDTEKRWEKSELFSFSPGNALRVHQPLGGLNRARTAIYKRLSDFRHERDGKEKVEPTLNTY